jgi:hypothetical protein
LIEQTAVATTLHGYVLPVTAERNLNFIYALFAISSETKFKILKLKDKIYFRALGCLFIFCLFHSLSLEGGANTLCHVAAFLRFGWRAAAGREQCFSVQARRCGEA